MIEALDKLPYSVLVIAALLLGFAPFYPVPHLIEKLGMLKNGTLSRPIDIFDLLMHASPFILLVAKIIRDVAAK